MSKKFGLLSAGLLVVALVIGVAGTSLAQAEPVTFIFGRGGDSVQLDPAVVTDGESFRVTNQGCESLLAYEEETTNVIPSLATSWSSNEDATVWTFQLREGVVFHDGTPFNADAVVFNFERWRFTDNPYHFEEQVFEYYEAMWGGFDDESIITSVEATGEYEVTFTLAEPLAPMLANLAMPMFNIASPTAIQEYGPDYGTPEVGFVCTGPYRFVEWVPDDRIVLERFEDYWGEIEGNVDRIVIRTIPDNSARFAALQSGEIHAMEQANIEDLNIAEESEDLYVLTRPALNTAYLAFNYRIQEFNDVRVRQAISLAIDRQAIVDAFYGRYGLVANTFLPPVIWGHNDEIVAEYNPERARELLAEAGFPDGFSEVTLDDGSRIPLTLYFMPIVRFYNPDPEGIAQAQANYLADIGIQVQLETAGDWATYLDLRRNGELIGLYQLGWGGDNGDPDNFLCYFFCSPGNPREGFYDNPELAAILQEARVTPNQADREALYKEAEAILYADAGRIFIAHQQTPLVFRNEVEGYIPNAVGTDLYRFVTVRTDM
ncbi:MAG: ABC transporter substrate-binding protein [Anaerolineae bacterium]